ncbi:MAG: histidine kinase [Spirulina sp. SIO3F2]|nr:histidine kinase [Spirulina sp. SIO3F2]
MNYQDSSASKPIFKVLDYFAIYDQKNIQYLAIATILICLAPTILQLSGADFGITSPPLSQAIQTADSTQLNNVIHRALSGSFVHTILEWSAFCTGLLTAILAFVYFALNRDVATPILGLSLFYAGCMDAFHTLAADRLITGVASPENLIPFTWAICRLFSALILLVGVSLFLVPKRFHPQRKLSFLVFITVLASLVAYVTIAICVRIETLPQTMFPEAMITRPWDVAPLILFMILGLFVLPRFYQKYPSLFTQSLIISMIPQVATQLHMAFGSTALFDSAFNIAHFLKILAYLIPFIGLCLTYIKIHREKEKTVQQLMSTEFSLQQQKGQLESTLQALQSTQAQLIQTEKMSSLGQLVAGVAHEINNPVNFIYGNLTHSENYIHDIRQVIALYQEHYPNPHPALKEQIEAVELDYLLEDFDGIFKSMRLGADRIRSIVLSLRNFSRLDEANTKDIDIHEGIDSTLIILGNRLKAKHDRPEIAVIKNYGALPPINCYPSQLNQVFMNILGNAIDALAEQCQCDNPHPFKPQICITTQFVDSQCIIELIDNGPGIPERIQNQIFDPFFTTKPIGKGTGLGLSISYKIITQAHQGQLLCHSNAQNGTQFTIILPQPLEETQTCEHQSSAVL